MSEIFPSITELLFFILLSGTYLLQVVNVKRTDLQIILLENKARCISVIRSLKLLSISNTHLPRSPLGPASLCVSDDVLRGTRAAHSSIAFSLSQHN